MAIIDTLFMTEMGEKFLARMCESRIVQTIVTIIASYNRHSRVSATLMLIQSPIFEAKIISIISESLVRLAYTVFFILRHFPESFPVWGFQEMPGTQCIDCITVFSCSLFIGSTVSTNLLRKKIALPITSNRHKSLFITEIERKRVKLNQLLTHDIFHWLFIT